MSEHAAFLRTIIENPADDGPRRVYADWLEEQGNGGRADFIRTQIQLASMGGDRLRCDRDPAVDANAWGQYRKRCRCRVCRLRQREYYSSCRFVTHHPPDGWNTLPIYVYGTSWRRGFIERIFCRWWEWGGDPKRRQFCEKCGLITVCTRHKRCAICDSELVRRFHGWAALILSCAPIRQVKLTTWPRLSDHGGDEINNADEFDVRVVLSRRWPGIDFELPKVSQSEYRDANFELMFSA